MKISDNLKEILEDIQYLQEHYHAVQAAIRMLGTRDIFIGQDPVTSAIMKLELDRWRDCFLMALGADDKTRDRIRAAAHDRFLRDGLSVVKWMSHDGQPPTRWLKATEDEFRSIVREAFLRGGQDRRDDREETK